jgi:oxalate decarboxylase/phosphoglucose isomerase-like protein (cupin superfamily)
MQSSVILLVALAGLGYVLLKKGGGSQQYGVVSPTGQGSTVFNLAGSVPKVSNPGGTMQLATADDAPILDVPQNQILENWAISMGLLSLNAGGVLEPHWHPNANEILYCTSGTGVITLFNGAPVVHESFSMNPGDLAFVPRGFLHDVENVGSATNQYLIGWDNQRFQTQGISGAVGASLAIMNPTFATQSFWNNFSMSPNDVGIGVKPAGAQGPVVVTPQPKQQQQQPTANVPQFAKSQRAIVSSRKYPEHHFTFYAYEEEEEPKPKKALATTPIIQPVVSKNQQNNVLKQNILPFINQAASSSPYKYALDSSVPSLNTAGGTNRQANVGHFPILKGMAVFSIRLNAGGIREPHWHPNAGEVHNVISGNMHYFVSSPSSYGAGINIVDQGDIGPGMFFFAPPGFLHYFTNNSKTDELHIAAFFTHNDPGDVGLSGGISSYSNSVLAATFNQPVSIFNNMPRFQSDDAIVGGPRS